MKRSFLVYRFAKSMDGKLTKFMLFGSMLFGLLTFTYGFMSNPYIALILVLFMGPSYQLRDLAQETMYQNSTDQNTLTKILAAKSTLVQLIFIISIIVIGGLTDLFGIRFVYIFAGSLLMFSALMGVTFLLIRGRGLSLEKESSIIS